MPKYTLFFAPETMDQLDAIDRKYHSLIRKTIREQLSFSPERETRNRKPLERPTPLVATWELRFGERNRYRVFYEVRAPGRIVRVLAIGVKEGNRLFVGGKEIEL